MMPMSLRLESRRVSLRNSMYVVKQNDVGRTDGGLVGRWQQHRQVITYPNEIDLWTRKRDG